MNYSYPRYEPMDYTQVTYRSAIDNKNYPLGKTDSLKVVFEEIIRAGEEIRKLRREVDDLMKEKMQREFLGNDPNASR